MWLKLDTGMVVMLLLFKVLKGTDGHLTPAQQGFAGDLSAHIKSLTPAVTLYLEGDRPCSGYGGGGPRAEQVTALLPHQGF